MTDPTKQHVQKTIDEATRQLKVAVTNNADEAKIAVDHHFESPWSFLWIDDLWKVATASTRATTKLMKTTLNTLAQLDQHDPAVKDSPYSPLAVSFRSYQSVLEIWTHWMALPPRLAVQTPPPKSSEHLVSFGAATLGAGQRTEPRFRGPYDVYVANPFEEIPPDPGVVCFAIAPDGATVPFGSCTWEADRYMIGFAAGAGGDQKAVDAFVAAFDELNQHVPTTGG